MSLLITYKGIIIFIWFALIFIGERLFRAASYPPSMTPRVLWGRLIRNLSLSSINLVLSPLLIIPLTLFLGNQFTSWRPEWMQHPAFFLLDLLLLDAFLYWWHRANHRLPFLWRFHQVHHLDEFLDSTSALRFHFGEVLLSALVRVLFIAAFAIPVTSVIIVEIILMVCTIFHHSNLAVPARLERSLRKVIVTPAIHWVHHHPQQADTDSNYAAIFSFWDKLFGSRNRKLRWQDMPIGVEQHHELSLWQLLVRPLRRSS